MQAAPGYCPLGPALVTTDEITDPHSLPCRTRVNGEQWQGSNTEQLVHNVDACVSYCSQFFKLLPGDVILTGTPPGVGCFHKPEPRFLKVGDVCEVEIDGIGTLSNKVS